MKKPSVSWLRNILTPLCRLVELGGSIGLISAYVGSLIEENVPCRIVEANRHIAGICRINANVARPNRNSLVEVAVLAYGAEEVGFFISENIHVSKIAMEGEANEMVPATTLARQIEKIGGSDGFTLIMDIEGAEYDVFEQEPHAFENCKLAIIEFHPDFFKNVGRSVDSFFLLAQRAGMVVEEVKGNCAVLVKE